MEKFSARIKCIVPNPDKGFDVTITVCNESEFDLLLDKTRDNTFIVKDKTYTFTINGNEMNHPGNCEINEIMNVYHKYEFSDNLNPTLRRMWKTGSLIDNIVYKLINTGILRKINENEI
ncbi:MAG: hypothetical protein RBT49_02565 [Bacteroidales bacterium]|jgi:hypothetical protein|nr:hypothetical protein [Bacteroidales bacterium]